MIEIDKVKKRSYFNGSLAELKKFLDDSVQRYTVEECPKKFTFKVHLGCSIYWWKDSKRLYFRGYYSTTEKTIDQIEAYQKKLREEESRPPDLFKLIDSLIEEAANEEHKNASLM